MLSRNAKVVLLTGLYFAQGLPWGFFTQAFPVILRQRGSSLKEIGLVGLLNLPWALKFLWSPLVDRWSGSPLGPRRGWILPLQAAAVLLLCAVGALDVSQATGGLFWVGVGFLLLNTVSATQDIATDGLAVTLLTDAERGLGNGVQVGGYRLGMIVGGGFLLVLYSALGWQAAFGLMAGLTLLSSVPIWLYREARGVVQAAPAAAVAPRLAWWPTLVSLSRRPGALRWAGVLCLYKTGDAMATGMIRPLLVDRGLGVDDVGWLLGTAGSAAALAGAAVGGLLLSRMERRTGLLAFGVMQLLSVAVWIWPAAGPISSNGLYAVSIFEHFANSMATVALFTAMMDVCDPEQAGTDYTVQACLVVIASGGLGVLSGFAADALGYLGHFSVATVACGLTVLATAALTRDGLPHAPQRG